ncbi:MerR HTH family regulatory protein [Paucidesulfovibrio gracilis DSM 16080]|uniref:MerR HTH family regulatory protein n=1 Tax=Paucidesulfovibrio gracilis DSM 16080 TaxID=1121449 RepID=A0A1T4WCR6_9BACT|nr:chaperone modulator CbpM [Paucidesulfovibrio gracilis]SKA74491.1 MerR HTH family regulatory protein [Paucidesulfovibrio gracilis DSM 16080]
MTTKRLKEILCKVERPNLPERSELVAWAQLVEITRVEPAHVSELLELGWISPVKTRAEEYLFRLRDVYRIQKLMRLCRDLDISVMGASIVVDLLERIEQLEDELERTKRLI